MSVRQLIVGGVTVPVYAMTNISQQYGDISARSRKRTADGTLVIRSLWSGKLSTVITGAGLIPAGLQDIDFDSDFELSCIAHRAVNSATNTITIPAARRADTGSEPYGRALVGAKWIATPVTGIVANVATLTPVTGASLYQCVYFPKITAAGDLTEGKPQHGPLFGWTLTAEET